MCRLIWAREIEGKIVNYERYTSIGSTFANLFSAFYLLEMRQMVFVNCYIDQRNLIFLVCRFYGKQKSKFKSYTTHKTQQNTRQIHFKISFKNVPGCPFACKYQIMHLPLCLVWWTSQKGELHNHRPDLGQTWSDEGGGRREEEMLCYSMYTALAPSVVAAVAVDGGKMQVQYH